MGVIDGFENDTFIFDARPTYPFLITANRYVPSSTQVQDSYSNNVGLNAFTLIMAHCTGGHKEQWEPTISDLWSQFITHKDVQLREIWSIDCANHGDAALLNEYTLRWGYNVICM